MEIETRFLTAFGRMCWEGKTSDLLCLFLSLTAIWEDFSGVGNDDPPLSCLYFLPCFDNFTSSVRCPIEAGLLALSGSSSLAIESSISSLLFLLGFLEPSYLTAAARDCTVVESFEASGELDTTGSNNRRV